MSAAAYRSCARCGVTRLTNESRDVTGVCESCPRSERPDTLTPRQRGTLARDAVRRAQQLACLVRDEGHDTIGEFLDRLDLQNLYALTVTLAAMVDIDRPVDELIAWTHESVVA